MHHFAFLLAVAQNYTTHIREGQLFTLHRANPRLRSVLQFAFDGSRQ